MFAILADRSQRMKDYHVIYNTDTKEMWLTHRQGSGMTVQVPNFKTYFTSAKDNDHFDSWTLWQKMRSVKGRFAIVEVCLSQIWMQKAMMEVGKCYTNGSGYTE